MNLAKSALPALIMAACFCVAACSSVSPWERGNLAKPEMAAEPYPMQSSLRSHQYGSREASSGGGNASGGGCGCY